MDKTDQLLIRAIKSKYPFDRVHSVYRRLYGKFPQKVANEALFCLLSELCDKYSPISSYTFAAQISQTQKDGLALYSVPLYHLRFTRADKFEGITWKTQQT